MIIILIESKAISMTICIYCVRTVIVSVCLLLLLLLQKMKLTHFRTDKIEMHLHFFFIKYINQKYTLNALVYYTMCSKQLIITLN